ncbi:MAG TPA: DUF4129 domain-containing protein, partial [Thiotrichales bacterium]|nr:DUF4129 domain-containing protein [Thiotrichales bacterium]
VTGLDYSKLDVLVDQIWQPEAGSDTGLLYRAILDWLKAIGLDVDSEAVSGFLQTYLPSADSLMLFARLAAGLLVLVMLIFLLRKFYRAGGFGRGGGKDDNPVQGVPPNPVLTPGAIEKLPLREQAGALLQYSIELLRRQRLIPLSACYTNHELLDRLAQGDSQQAGLLSRQIRLTEPLIYGDRPVTEAALDQAWRLNRAIAAGEVQP